MAIWESEIGGGGDSRYSNALPSVITVGGIEAGTTFDNVTTSEVFDGLFYPELFPTLVNPSSTFTLAQSGLLEIGATTTLSFSSSFNRGSISPAYGTSGHRSGLPTSYIYTGTGLTDVASTDLTNSNSVNDYLVSAGAQSWTGRVAYSEGEQPLSSKGNDYSTPLAAGQTAIVTRTITGVYPWFATTSNITTLTKQALASHSATFWQATVVAESGSDKQAIDLPQAFSAVTGIQFFNTVSNTWEWIGGSKAASVGTFTTTANTREINGNTINYDRMTHNGATIGARQLRFYTN